MYKIIFLSLSEGNKYIVKYIVFLFFKNKKK